MATTDPTPHVPILQPGSLMCVCGKRDNDYSAHPYGIVATAKPGQEDEQHAEALWHTLWFHTLSLHTTHRDVVSADDPDASLFDSDEEREAYNAYQSERDIEANSTAIAAPWPPAATRTGTGVSISPTTTP